MLYTKCFFFEFDAHAFVSFLVSVPVMVQAFEENICTRAANMHVSHLCQIHASLTQKAVSACGIRPA
jgi:hypothetical protein